jgi:Resolvase, N terminal domain
MTQNQRLASKPSVILSAKYVRMSTGHQQYSIDNQTDAINRYAREHNMEIVQTYTDSGKSGASTRLRDSFWRRGAICGLFKCEIAPFAGAVCHVATTALLL